jgi:4-aminobutyrate aminotransferase-like enzyme
VGKKSAIRVTCACHTTQSSGYTQIAKGDGCYFLDYNGKRYLDFNSMAMCSSLGHTVDPSIIDAVVEQMKTVAYAYPGYFITEIRAKLGKVVKHVLLEPLGIL